MTTHEINLLIERYLDGETTLAEERELALAVQREDRPAEWAIIAEMLGELTLDEALYETSPNPSVGGANLGLSSSHSDLTTPLLWRGWGRSWGWTRWAAAACIAIAFGLSYYIIKEEPQELAQAELPQPAKNAPSEPVLSRDWSHARAAAPHVKSPQSSDKVAAATPASERDTTLEAPQPEPLPEVEPQLIAEAQEPTPPAEDLALHLALLAEVEARAIMLQQPRPHTPLHSEAGLEREGGEWSLSPTINLAEYEVSTPLCILPFDKSHKEGQGVGLLLNELLVNIQQHSNRPELSL